MFHVKRLLDLLLIKVSRETLSNFTIKHIKIYSNKNTLNPINHSLEVDNILIKLIIKYLYLLKIKKLYLLFIFYLITKKVSRETLTKICCRQENVPRETI